MNKRFFVIITAAIAILVCNHTFVFCNSSNIVGEILKMHKSGLSEETILIYLQSRHAEFDLTSKDLITLKNAGFSEEFIQVLLQFRKMPDYDVPQMYDYGASYFSYSLRFNYGCFPLTCNSSPCQIWGQFSTAPVAATVDQKRYFYSGGHAYVRHNGHFHTDDDHRFQSVTNINQLSENAFISQRTAPRNSIHASFKGVSVSNRWTGKSGNSGKPMWAPAKGAKNNQPAASFHGLRGSKTPNKIGSGGTKTRNK